MSDWPAIREILSRGEKFAVTSHIYPDGDAVGSMIAFLRLLRAIGKSAFAINPAAVPATFRFLEGSGEILVYRREHDQLVAGCDALFILDSSTNDRLGAIHGAARRLGLRRVCIDHHRDNVVDADLKIVDPDACSTAQLVYEMFRDLGVEIGREAAEALYTAIHTDTVSFNFLGTDARTHEIAADLLRRGVDPKRLWMRIYGNESPGLLRLAGGALSRLRLEEGGRIAWLEVREHDWRSQGVNPNETEAFTRYPLTLKGVGVIALFCEEGRERTRVSLRALDNTDMAEVARLFGGGGHRTSAGATVAAPFEQVVEGVIGALKSTLR